MIDLRDTTFMIPVSIESDDRRTNTLITLSYLCKHLDTNIIIYEHDTVKRVPEILDKVKSNKTNIDYIYHDSASDDGIFHRTKFLNIMLSSVKTRVVVNYDVDVLLLPRVYEICANLIRDDRDLIYPYFWGRSQYQVNYAGRDKIATALDLTMLEPTDYNVERSEYGQCQFFNTQSYKDGGMENEGFVSYAPEDQERGYRFKELGYKVGWDYNYIYHLEHTRGPNSSTANPKMQDNFALFDTIKSMSKDQLVEYYANVDYIKKYQIK